MLLLIDNYDSFTHNLARYFEELKQEVLVVRNDEISCTEIEAMGPEYLVFSPGPCTPDSAGVTLEAIKTFAGRIPILGVCLGHQAIGMAFGANLVNAQQIRHGKTSQVQHQQSILFKGINRPFAATRYHSLVLETASIPEAFTITAWCFNNANENCASKQISEQAEVMAIEHKTLAIFGVQFHPESLLTEFGHHILNNFIFSKTTTKAL
ncbi:aminodeoxychorismate/anthranilate synthase component II [uncultured Paraglaciecola sp.]|uniref:anthranilate synthase component II n=1 Tax=uncultured Paraglaciecola sp. TaxID=1765024 RepID=UPI0030D76E4C|tara:strand:+ start:155135 stop:155761 length:627 start_codon:yes stop_codon:yes gene_type:complete